MPPRPAAHRTRPLAVGTLAVAVAGLVGVLAHQTTSASPSAAPSTSVADAAVPSTVVEAVPGPPALAPLDGLGLDDGAVPAGVTVFDDDVPAVARLDAALLNALRQAAAQAAVEGIELIVNSGWRSPPYQERLMEEAVAQHGSRAAAARWVAPPETSAHVSGDAVDIGPSPATTWLASHGAAFGLCQVYENEPWHFELRPEAVDDGCPPPYADPTHDPRLQR